MVVGLAQIYNVGQPAYGIANPPTHQALGGAAPGGAPVVVPAVPGVVVPGGEPKVVVHGVVVPAVPGEAVPGGTPLAKVSPVKVATQVDYEEVDEALVKKTKMMKISLSVKVKE
jgi:hypothetical protein